MTIRHAHCCYCGHRFADGAAWPRLCTPCGNISYANPIPVGVVLLPVGGGLLTVRRAIEPAIGQLALPGGFLDLGETWQEGCARELREETGVVIAAAEVSLYAAHSTPRGQLLIFGLAQPRRAEEIAFVANDEASEVVVIDGPRELAFPLHTLVTREYFAGRRVGVQ